MNSSQYKRKRNDAKTKFRSLWKEKKHIINGNINNKNGENVEELFNLDDSKDFPSLNGDIEIKKIHPPKIKYALAFGFLGTRYHGYQKQVDYKTGVMDKVKTVEGTIENCLIKVGGIDEAFRNMTYKLQMSKSSRTDKGVHAACTYIGGKFNIESEINGKDTIDSINNIEMDENNIECSNNINLDNNSNSSQSTIDSINNIEIDGNNLTENNIENNEDNIIDIENIDYSNVLDTESNSTPDRKLTKEEIFIKKLNRILPEDIRCFKIQRVTKGFDARSMCSKRKYEYVLPEWVLRRRYEVPNEEHLMCFNNLYKLFEENIDNNKNIKLSKTDESIYENIGKYIDMDIDYERFEKIIKQYEGTHDFHNFTVKQKLESNNTQRYIYKINIKKDRIENLDIIKIIIVGQSFLYNQIRKMISLGIQEYIKITPENTIKFSLNRFHTLNINVIPSEGLILHHPYYESYNITRCNPPKVPYIDYKDIKKDVELFKIQFIYPEIKRLIDSNIWEGWLDNILKYPFYLDNQNVTDGEYV